ncbi:MAG: RNA polymerase sigma factor (sigma-70 family) [Rhodothermales bacterium]|jgi:RNA polymerase sigma factor (sigma-70 family)
MEKESAWQTRESLLQRVRDPQDEKSWEDFVQYYRPFIYNLVRRMNIQHHDAEEIVQTVLVKSWNKMPSFEYDRGRGRFRGWLCQVTGNTVRDFIRKRRTSMHRHQTDDYDDEHYLQEIKLPEIEKLAEREWKRFISGLAWEAVSKRFKPHVLQAFLWQVEGRPMAEICPELGIAESSVYVYKSRVQKELRAEIIRLNRKLDV